MGPRTQPPEGWPKPLRARRWLRVRLAYHRGVLRQQTLSLVTYRTARTHRRMATRFLGRVYAGTRLLDVVCFNFPLLAPVESFTAAGRRIMRQMEANLRTAVQLALPFPPKADGVEIEDIGTGRRWRLALAFARPKRGEVQRRGRRRPRARRRPAEGTAPRARRARPRRPPPMGRAPRAQP